MSAWPRDIADRRNPNYGELCEDNNMSIVAYLKSNRDDSDCENLHTDRAGSVCEGFREGKRASNIKKFKMSVGALNRVHPGTAVRTSTRPASCINMEELSTKKSGTVNESPRRLLATAGKKAPTQAKACNADEALKCAQFEVETAKPNQFIPQVDVNMPM